MANSKLDEVVSLAKRRGFVFPAGEIYGGTRSAWDYGPLGVALKDNIKREWWRAMVVTRPDVVGVDTSIILPSAVWVASGHVSVFNDPLITPGWKRTYAKLKGVNLPPISQAAYAKSLVQKGVHNVRNNGPKEAARVVTNFFKRRKSRSGETD